MHNEHSFLTAIYSRQEQAEQAVHLLAEAEFPLDQISLLARTGGSGDDVIGIVHPDVGERVQVWGRQGMLWGGLLGVLAGAAGLVFVPEIGPLLVLGPLANMISGGALGAGMVGAGSAAAAGLSQLGVMLQRHGIPEEKLDELHQAIEQGDTIVLLPADMARLDQAERLLRDADPRQLEWLGTHHPA